MNARNHVLEDYSSLIDRFILSDHSENSLP